MRFGIIINPISGASGSRQDEGRRRRALAEHLTARLGVDATIAMTDRRGHAADLARDFVAAGVDTVIAWGGDGTVNEAAGPLIASSTSIGIVPSGSGDGLARSVGLPLAPEAALENILTGSVAKIDVGWIAGRHFLNIAGVGFDAAVGVAFGKGPRRGAWGYAKNGLTLVWSYESRHYHVAIDDDVLTGRKFLVGFANGREYGNGLVLAPDADARDGWLDAVIVYGGSALRQLWRARRLGFRRREPAEGVLRTRTREATITGEHLLCHADGETFTTSGRIDVRVTPRALGIRGLLTP